MESVLEERVVCVENELEKQLLMLISTAQWRRDLDDGWLWKDGEPNCYTVCSGYKALKEYDLSLDRSWYKQIWNTKAAGPA